MQISHRNIIFPKKAICIRAIYLHISLIGSLLYPNSNVKIKIFCIFFSSDAQVVDSLLR